MTEKTDSKERADFEAWYRTTNWPSDLGCYEGRYMSNIADASWQAWHARASLAASAGSEPVAWRYVDARGHFRYVGYKPSRDMAAEYPLLKPIRLYDHPSPPEGMVGGWQDMATAPVAGLILLVVEDSAGERRVFPAEASHENGVWVWQVTLGWLGWTRLHSGWTPILWRRIPPPPTTSAGSGKGE